MDKVLLVFDGHADYLFEIDDICELENARDYKNKMREKEEYDCYSDFEIMLDFLDKNNVKYNYIELFNVKKLTY